jgi:glycosyltransferase involved in cell wall biosynthesis
MGSTSLKRKRTRLDRTKAERTVPSHSPPLTVAIPTCNGTAHLADALHSILNQECPPFDLLVSDDHSDDETVTLVRDIAGERARIVVNEERLGLAGNWNQCMTLSQTPWVSIFHQDDVMLPGHLASVMRGLEPAEKQTEKVGFLAGPAKVIDDQSRPVAESIVDPGGRIPNPPGPGAPEFVEFRAGEFAAFLRTENPLRCSAVVTSRAAHAEVGGFDPSYRYVVDWEFWYLVASRYAVSWKTDEPSVLIRWHAASETHRFKTGTADLVEIARLITFIRLSETPERAYPRKQAEHNLCRAYLNRAHEALRAGQIELARTCLSSAWSISSRTVLGTVAADPRLCLQVATLAASARLARRWFGSEHEKV